MVRTNNRHYLLLIILGALTALAPFSIDTYLPGFPAIAKSFGISTGRVTLSLSSFFIGIALGQIIYGPLLERFGRKKPLHAGLLLYLVATAGCYLASSLEVLVVFRFIQAIGSCAAGVVAMTMVRDIFPVKDNAKIYSQLMLVMGASPLIAPTIGSAISATYGWRAIFAFLFLLALVILLASVGCLAESHKGDENHSMKSGPILRRFKRVLVVPQFIIYAIGGGIALSGLLAFIANSPSIFMEGYGVSNSTYGWIFAMETAGFIGFSQLNGILSKFYRPEQTVMRALSAMAVLSTFLLWGSIANRFEIKETAVIIFLILGCIGILNPNATALSMAPFELEAGTAASLYGFIQWGIAGLVSIVISTFKSTSAVPLSGILTGTALLAIVVLSSGRRAIKLKALQN